MNPAFSSPRTAPDGQTAGAHWVWAVALASFAVDQLAKALVVSTLDPGQSVPFLGPVASVTHRTNTGVAFGLLQGHASVAAVLGGVVTVAILILGPRLLPRTRACFAGLGLVVGGAAGNFLDRVRLGHVVDYLDFHFWPVFNAADIAITVGAIMITGSMLFEARHARVAPQEEVPSACPLGDDAECSDVCPAGRE